MLKVSLKFKYFGNHKSRKKVKTMEWGHSFHWTLVEKEIFKKDATTAHRLSSLAQSALQNTKNVNKSFYLSWKVKGAWRKRDCKFYEFSVENFRKGWVSK